MVTLELYRELHDKYKVKKMDGSGIGRAFDGFFNGLVVMAIFIFLTGAAVGVIGDKVLSHYHVHISVDKDTK